MWLSGFVRFDAFTRWWSDLILSSPVALVHTAFEYDTLQEEERFSNRPLVLMIGFSFCVPCKRFTPIFREFAARFPDVRFAYMSGNENAETVIIGRDRLKVQGSPAFFMWVNGELVARWTGAKQELLEERLKEGLTQCAPASRFTMSV